MIDTFILPKFEDTVFTTTEEYYEHGKSYRIRCDMNGKNRGLVVKVSEEAVRTVPDEIENSILQAKMALYRSYQNNTSIGDY